MSPILRTTSLRARLKNQIHCRSRREEAQISDDLAKNQSLPMNGSVSCLIQGICRSSQNLDFSPFCSAFIGTMPLLFADLNLLTSAPTILRHALNAEADLRACLKISKKRT